MCLASSATQLAGCASIAAVAHSSATAWQDLKSCRPVKPLPAASIPALAGSGLQPAAAPAGTGRGPQDCLYQLQLAQHQSVVIVIRHLTWVSLGVTSIILAGWHGCRTKQPPAVPYCSAAWAGTCVPSRHATPLLLCEGELESKSCISRNVS